jgi:glutamate--cysteine ligase
MSNPGEADLTPITDRRQLAAWFDQGSKPRPAWGIGTEHEKFGFYHHDLAPPPYDPGATRAGGIRTLLEGFQPQGWAPILDAGSPIGLTRDKASISLEPGGQFELSGAPLSDLHAGWAELQNHLEETRVVAGPLGMGFAPLGFHPLATRENMPWMPKGRYMIMRNYMPRVGRMGLDMMLRTCTVQVNLDFGSEADMVHKLRVSLALQPVATALFANSPFLEGKPNGLRTLRGRVWTETDPDRTGIPAVAFEQGFGFERFVDYVLDVPMYFIMREGRWIDCAGASFRAFMAKGLPSHPGVTASIGDWGDHVTTVFTDVRLKRFLEMRGADAGSPEMLHALPAFWTGLLYDPAALAAAGSLVRDWPVAEMQALRVAVPEGGLTTPFRGRTVREVAADAVAIAREGLKARGLGEEVYLAPLEEIIATGETQADKWLRLFHGEWQGDASRIFAAAAI